MSLVDFVATGKKWAVDGSIVLAPRLQKSSLKQPSFMLSTREVLLTDLRAEVIALGMKAEYGYVHRIRYLALETISSTPLNLSF